MVDTISEPMAGKNQKPKSGKNAPTSKPAKYPSRAKVKYVGIPRELHAVLKAMTKDESSQFHGRSCAYLATISIKQFLKRLPPKSEASDPPAE